MASSFAAQLKQIATSSTNELDLKAQKASHSESLVFERHVAGAHDFDTIYQICLEAFQDLCRLDGRFTDFERNIFGLQSKSMDRTQMTRDENQALDITLDSFLSLVGSKLQLRPAIKAVEWLVRRFRVHTYNTAFLVLTFLPYHETSIFQHLLSILPTRLPPEFKFLKPYLQTATSPPRHAIVYSVTNADGLFQALNKHVLQVCDAGHQYPRLLSFWAGVVTEAVSGQLDATQSGRREVQQQRQDDVLHKILPMLNDVFSINGLPELSLTACTLSIILASKANLTDKVIDHIMEAIALALPQADSTPSVICMMVLFRHKSNSIVSRNTMSRLIKWPTLHSSLGQLDENYEVGHFVLGLLRSSIARFKKNNFATRIDFAEKLLRTMKAEDPMLVDALESIIERVVQMQAEDPVNAAAKVRMDDLVRRLDDENNFHVAVQQAVARLGNSNLEVDLQLVLDIPAQEAVENLEAGNSASQGPSSDAIDDVLSRIPERTVDERSFLAQSDSHLFGPLRDAFLLVYRAERGKESFESLAIWQSAPDSTEPLFLSFLLRMASGVLGDPARAAAVKMATEFVLKQAGDWDGQAVLPYVTALLGDSHAMVRREAAALVNALDKVMSVDLVDGETARKWAASDLYRPGQQSLNLTWLSAPDASQIVRKVYLPVLEECILDSKHIARVLRSALESTSSNTRVNEKTEPIQLKKDVRQNLFDFLLGHIQETPLYITKVKLLELLEPIDKVGSKIRSKALSKMLESWTGQNAMSLSRICAETRLDVSELEGRMVAVVSLNDKDGFDTLLSLLDPGVRATFVTAVTSHLVNSWPCLTGEKQAAFSQTLIQHVVGGVEHGPRSQFARDVLIAVMLPSQALGSLLDTVNGLLSRTRDTSPVNKRRRLSHNASVGINSTVTGDANSKIGIATFVLELLDSSASEMEAEMLGPSFQLLASLQHLRGQMRSALPYLLTLVLGMTLTVVNKASTTSKKVLHNSVVRTELLIDCARMTESPQVQNAALLLLAALCKVVPAQVLHNIMPIFTFMSTGVLMKEDEHSLHVIDQTISLVIPPLIQSLRTQKRDLVVAASELLHSFIAAFDHTPSHRRLPLFQDLASKLGAQDLLYAIVVMLATRESTEEEADTTTFLSMFMSTFDLDTQLVSYSKYIKFSAELLRAEQNQAHAVLSLKVKDTTVAREKAALLLRTLSHLLQSMTFRHDVRKQAREGPGKTLFRTHLPQLLGQILELEYQVKADNEMKVAVSRVHDALLQLPSLIDYIGIVEDTLERQGHAVLLLLHQRLQKEIPKDKATQMSALSFLQVLEKLLTTTSDNVLRHRSLICIDSICEQFGRGDPTAVLQSAGVLSDTCLVAGDDRITTATLLSVASMIEILKEGVIPIVGNLLVRTFAILERSLQDGKEDAQQHDAALALLIALLTHVPFVISDAHIDSILSISAQSCEAELGPNSPQSRLDLLQLVAQKIDLKALVSAAHRTWHVAVENGPGAVKEVLEMLGLAVDHSKRSGVVANADIMAEYLLQAFDLRRVQLTVRSEDSYEDAEVVEVEDGIGPLTIKIIYKLNDNVFRPIFSHLVDWAIKCPGIKKESFARAHMLRQTTLFRFITTFLDTLKGIVISYTSYILEPAISVLTTTAALVDPSTHKLPQPLDTDTFALWHSTLTMLRAAFTHDLDSFFHSPSHFTPLASALISNLTLAPHPDTTALLIPTIVALATTVLDTPAHLKTLNHHICLLRHTESAPVRLATVQCQRALTDDEDVGTEWLETCIRAGEGLVYANEMLEDDDEGVETEVRRWVRRVNEVLGEDILEA